MSGLEVPKRRIWMLSPLETSERNLRRKKKKNTSCNAQKGEGLTPAMGSGTPSWVCWGSSIPRGWQEARPSRGRTDTKTGSQVLGVPSCGAKVSSPRQRSSKSKEDILQTSASLTSLWYPSRFPERKQTSFSLFTHNISVLAHSLIPSVSSDPNYARHRYGTSRRTCLGWHEEESRKTIDPFGCLHA